MFGLPDELVITIPDKTYFYSLYADGIFSRKTYFPDSGETLLAYPPGSVIFLYYTYPSHRAASVIRNVPGNADLPGLSKKVRLLFTVHASRVDKLKRSVGYLNKNAGGSYCYPDGFYIRLYFILHRRGKLNYLSLRKVADNENNL